MPLWVAHHVLLQGAEDGHGQAPSDLVVERGARDVRPSRHELGLGGLQLSLQRRGVAIVAIERFGHDLPRRVAVRDVLEKAEDELQVHTGGEAAAVVAAKYLVELCLLIPVQLLILMLVEVARRIVHVLRLDPNVQAFDRQGLRHCRLGREGRKCGQWRQVVPIFAAPAATAKAEHDAAALLHLTLGLGFVAAAPEDATHGLAKLQRDGLALARRHLELRLHLVDRDGGLVRLDEFVALSAAPGGALAVVLELVEELLVA
mmetsp:Transcript_13710/g.40486  ORF Transcript_13710/g.40486 Transcript_13710/m.40486 type:complete len:260 (-) Transcript_13710:1918-2697(-)